MNSMQDAEKMGREAFEAGKPRAPVLNQAFLEKHIADQPIGDSDVNDRLGAYLAGWDDANLSADVPGWTEEENAAMQRARKKETP